MNETEWKAAVKQAKFALDLAFQELELNPGNIGIFDERIRRLSCIIYDAYAVFNRGKTWPGLPTQAKSKCNLSLEDLLS